jgi:hypothetical protein
MGTAAARRAQRTQLSCTGAHTQAARKPQQGVLGDVARRHNTRHIAGRCCLGDLHKDTRGTTVDIVPRTQPTHGTQCGRKREGCGVAPRASSRTSPNRDSKGRIQAGGKPSPATSSKLRSGRRGSPRSSSLSHSAGSSRSPDPDAIFLLGTGWGNSLPQVVAMDRDADAESEALELEAAARLAAQQAVAAERLQAARRAREVERLRLQVCGPAALNGVTLLGTYLAWYMSCSAGWCEGVCTRAHARECVRILPLLHQAELDAEDTQHAALLGGSMHPSLPAPPVGSAGSAPPSMADAVSRAMKSREQEVSVMLQQAKASAEEEAHRARAAEQARAAAASAAEHAAASAAAAAKAQGDADALQRRREQEVQATCGCICG